MIKVQSTLIQILWNGADGEMSTYSVNHGQTARGRLRGVLEDFSEHPCSGCVSILRELAERHSTTPEDILDSVEAFCLYRYQHDNGQWIPYDFQKIRENYAEALKKFAEEERKRQIG